MLDVGRSLESYWHDALFERKISVGMVTIDSSMDWMHMVVRVRNMKIAAAAVVDDVATEQHVQLWAGLEPGKVM